MKTIKNDLEEKKLRTNSLKFFDAWQQNLNIPRKMRDYLSLYLERQKINTRKRKESTGNYSQMLPNVFEGYFF